MKFFKNLLAGLSLTVAALMAPMAANAGIAPLPPAGTYNFTGICTDCLGLDHQTEQYVGDSLASATLVIGNDLASSSFTYSSMLFPSLASTSISFLSLDVGSLPGLAYSSITFDTVLTQYEGTEYSSWTFYTIGFANGDGDGFWNLAPSSLLTADFGHSASWSNVSAVPEPETYAMMIAGLGLLGFAARRRKQQQAAA